jgi:hypothetical protein
MILDAGSSGTRLYVYQASNWTAAMKEPPQIHMVFQGKKANGLSQYLTHSRITAE